MSDHIDPVINKKIANTEWLYNKRPTYFKGMEFYEAISVRAYLARENAKRVRIMQQNCGDKEIYLQLEQWLNDIYRAIDFNKALLKELKHDKVYK